MRFSALTATALLLAAGCSQSAADKGAPTGSSAGATADSASQTLVFSVPGMH